MTFGRIEEWTVFRCASMVGSFDETGQCINQQPADPEDSKMCKKN